MIKHLKELLLEKAKELKPEIFDDEYPDWVEYDENINPHAANGKEWLDKGSSYIWKVGILMTWDSNKFDYCTIFIGHQRDPEAESEFIGLLHWKDGEGDDIGRCLTRYLKILRSAHPSFEDRYEEIEPGIFKYRPYDFSAIEDRKKMNKACEELLKASCIEKKDIKPLDK